MVHFSLNIKTCCLYVIWEKQDQIWAKISSIPKNMHSYTYAYAYGHVQENVFISNRFTSIQSKSIFWFSEFRVSFQNFRVSFWHPKTAWKKHWLIVCSAKQGNHEPQLSRGRRYKRHPLFCCIFKFSL